MHELYLNSMKDTLLVAIPFLAILVLSFFRLDAIIGSSKGPANPRRPPCGIDERGEPLLVDPDGRISKPRSRKK